MVNKNISQARRYKTLYKKARDAGLVRNKGDARSFKPSKYMKTKLNKLDVYLNDDYKVLAAPPKIRKQFKTKRNDTFGGVYNGKVIVKADSGFIPLIKNGRVTRIRKLKNGEHEQVLIPLDFTDMTSLEDAIKNNPDLSDMLKADDEELFAFKIFGYPSLGQFSTLEDLLEGLSEYGSLDPDINPEAQETFDTLEIFRSRNNWDFPEIREMLNERRAERERDRLARVEFNRRGRRRKKPSRERMDASNDRRKQSNAYREQLEREKAKRESETPEAREIRLAKKRKQQKAKRDAEKARG